MTQDDIEKAFETRLLAADIAPVAWEDREFTPDGEYIEFRHAPNTVTDDFISGGGEIEIGLVLLTAVVPANNFGKRAKEIAEQAKALFPKATRMTEASGTVVINAAPNFGSGFQDGAYWRKPLTISYITE